MEPKKFSSFHRNPKNGFVDSLDTTAVDSLEKNMCVCLLKRPDRTVVQDQAERGILMPHIPQHKNPVILLLPTSQKKICTCRSKRLSRTPWCTTSQEAWHFDTSPSTSAIQAQEPRVDYEDLPFSIEELDLNMIDL